MARKNPCADIRQNNRNFFLNSDRDDKILRLKAFNIMAQAMTDISIW
jgi:hypothetical protein